MRKIILIGALLSLVNANAQTQPKVYVNFVSHNEPDDQLQSNSNYTAMKALVLQLADTINTKGAAWNLQTCAGFVQGAVSVDGTTNNLFRTLAMAPYVDNIEIDPRYKSNTFGTLADLYHVLGTLGANRTHTLGGFLADTSQADWVQYEAPQTSTSNFYPPETWQCNIMWGAASMNHTNDIDNWGIWKPDNVNTFYTHNASRPIWYIGNGCSPDGTDYTINQMTQQPNNPASFDPTDNASDVINPLQRLIDSISNHLLPWDRFYNYSITINQSGFGTTLFSKIAQVCNSINAMDSSKVEWALLTEKLSKFQTWSNTNAIDYSQWECGEIYVASNIDEKKQFNNIHIFPNPAQDYFIISNDNTSKNNVIVTDILGKTIAEFATEAETKISTQQWENGLYILKMDNGFSSRLQVVH